MKYRPRLDYNSGTVNFIFKKIGAVAKHKYCYSSIFMKSLFKNHPKPLEKRQKKTKNIIKTQGMTGFGMSFCMDIRFFKTLSNKFFEQLCFRAILLDFRVKLVYIVRHRNQENLGEHLLFSAQQKLPERIVLLNYPERSFDLN